MYGPLGGSAEIVRNERLQQDDTSKPPTIRLDRDHPGVNQKLVNLTAKVELTSEQVAEETLSNAVLAFRRAASILAQEEDLIVFEGYGRSIPSKNSVFVANGAIEPQPGLADLPARLDKDRFVNFKGRGLEVVKKVVDAIHRLEDDFHTAPFACILGNGLYDRAYEPSDSLVLPADRIIPLLKGGPLLRSGKMDLATGIVVSLAGNAVDIVIGTPPTVQFLQRTTEAKFLFRVYERFVLRIRDTAKPPVAGFTFKKLTNAEKAEADAAEGTADTAGQDPATGGKPKTAARNVAAAATALADAKKQVEAMKEEFEHQKDPEDKNQDKKNHK
jgi:uncharacterized linocin/CFP29 family protein